MCTLPASSDANQCIALPSWIAGDIITSFFFGLCMYDHFRLDYVSGLLVWLYDLPVGNSARVIDILMPLPS